MPTVGFSDELKGGWFWSARKQSGVDSVLCRLAWKTTDLGVLNLWKPIIEILKKDENPDMRKYAAWIMGTGVQNNPDAQRKAR